MVQPRHQEQAKEILRRGLAAHGPLRDLIEIHHVAGHHRRIRQPVIDDQLAARRLERAQIRVRAAVQRIHHGQPLIIFVPVEIGDLPFRRPLRVVHGNEHVGHAGIDRRRAGLVGDERADPVQLRSRQRAGVKADAF